MRLPQTIASQIPHLSRTLRAAVPIAMALGLIACTRGEESSTGGAPALPPASSAATIPTPEATRMPTPIRPVLPEPPRGDNVASCYALVDAGRFDVALHPCLAALQADPGNERLIAAVKRIQANVVESMATPPGSSPSPAATPGKDGP